MLHLQLIIVHEEKVYWAEDGTLTFCTESRYSTIQLLRTVVPTLIMQWYLKQIA